MNKKFQNTLFRIRGISEKQQLPDSQRVHQRVHSDPTGWPSELRRRNQKRNAPGSNPTWRSAEFRDSTSLRGSRLPSGRKLTNSD